MSLYTHGRARRSLIDTVWLRAVSQLASILGLVVMVRGMSKQDFGTFNLLYAFIPLISMVASLGLEQTLRRYQPEYLQAGNLAAAGWLVRFVASARFGTNLILLSIILFSWNYAAPLIKLGAYRVEFALFCLLVVLYFQARILQISLAAHMLQRFSVGSTVVLALVRLVAFTTLFWHDALSVQNAILAETAAYGIAYVFMLGAYRRHCIEPGQAGKYRPERTERRRLLRYGIFNNFNDAGTLMLTTKTDNFFIAAIIDPISVGIYAFYTRLNGMVGHLLPVNLFENVVQPMFFSVRKEEADRKLPQYFSFLLNMNLMLQWPILAYAIVYHAEVVEVVFGGKFAEYSWLLPVMAGFATLNVISTPVTLVAQHGERAGIILISKVFGIFNVIGLLVLLPIMGVSGAAIASGSAQAMKNAFIWWIVRKRARWTNAWRALLSSIAVWGAVVVVCEGVKWATSGAPILNLCIGVVIIGLGVLVHVRGPSISSSDRTIMSAVLSGKEAWILRAIGLLGRGTTRAGPS